MRNDKEEIFTRIRKALEALPSSERTARPEVVPADLVAHPRIPEGTDSLDAFTANFEGVRGKVCHSVAVLAGFLKEKNCLKGYCDPSLKNCAGEPLSRFEFLEIEYEFSRKNLEDFTFAITKGSGVIAETGSIILKDGETVNRLAALAPWIHVAVVEKTALYRSLQEGIAAFGTDPNIILVTGPSKTADVEGILIEGVHGPGEEICLFI